MFTGIIEAVGELVAKESLGGGAALTISHPAWREGLEVGASVAVDGCCLTVVDADTRTFRVEATRPTLARTRFGELQPGEPLNLERPLAVGARLGGHWLQGHVDGVVRPTQIERLGESCYLEILVPTDARDWVAPRGSIALNGVSLTVQDVARGSARLAIIPHTWSNTNLSRADVGSSLHVEYDILAKYVAAAVRRHPEPDARDT